VTYDRRRHASPALFIVLTATLCFAADRNAGLQLNTGKQIWEAGCAACHGHDGKGMPKSTVGFEAPRTFPDFSECSQTTPEPNTAWKAVITRGGPFRGFSQIMPSFGEALTPAQIDKVIDYMRAFCDNPRWARGELNLPRALFTEKAFPEKEVVITTALNARGAPGVSSEIVHEQRLDMKNQIEIAVPVDFLHPNHTWFGGVGDVAFGLKHELFSSLRTGSILSVQGEVALPTGNRARELGSGTTTFGTFASYGQLLPGNNFLQLQGGADLPLHTSVAPQSLFYRMALGHGFNRGHGLGRLFAPMFEVVGDHDIVKGAPYNWDIAPEMQVTISKRQHLRANIGVRVPANHTAGRAVQVVFYLLWDWQDGRLNEGW
jgi:mono/diheme cytochrome c family protein